MNELQKYALKSVVEGHSVLITGSPGTGKSFLLTEIVKQLQQTGKKVLLWCSTGKFTYYRSLYFSSNSCFLNGMVFVSNIFQVLEVIYDHTYATYWFYCKMCVF
jgi:Cdc6-like AAA superfamily ATPase